MPLLVGLSSHPPAATELAILELISLQVVAYLYSLRLEEWYSPVTWLTGLRPRTLLLQSPLSNKAYWVTLNQSLSLG